MRLISPPPLYSVGSAPPLQIYSVVMVAALALDASATRLHVAIYYWCTAGMVALGLVAWIAVVYSPPAQHYFRLKDSSFAGTKDAPCYRSCGDEESEPAGAPPAVVRSSVDSSSSLSKAPLPMEDKSAENDATSTVDVAKEIASCQLALFLNIWSSIFVGAFFAYCPTDSQPLFGALGGALRGAVPEQKTVITCSLIAAPLTRRSPHVLAPRLLTLPLLGVAARPSLHYHQDPGRRTAAWCSTSHASSPTSWGGPSPPWRAPPS